MARLLHDSSYSVLKKHMFPLLFSPLSSLLREDNLGQSGLLSSSGWPLSRTGLSQHQLREVSEDTLAANSDRAKPWATVTCTGDDLLPYELARFTDERHLEEALRCAILTRMSADRLLES